MATTATRPGRDTAHAQATTGATGARGLYGGLEPAAAYTRISDPRKQRDNHSVEVQRAAIERLAAQLGCVVIQWEQEERKGRHIDRGGYQRILESARRHEITRILVFSFSRWGRGPLERVMRGDELDKLGVELWSVQQGRDKPGFMRYGHAGIDEEAVRQLAANVRPARRAAAESGTFMGPTPRLGYTRLYPAWIGAGKRPAGELIIDEATAWIVRELYARYDPAHEAHAQGAAVSCRSLARWMNTDPRVPAPRECAAWADHHVRAVLRSVVYKGWVSYDKTPQGAYERAAADGSDYYAGPGRHEALIDPAQWQRVQERMDTIGHAPGQARRRHVWLGADLLRCAGCGAVMRANVPATIPNHKGSYLCRTRGRGTGACAIPGYRLDLADAALVAQVARLRGRRWTPVAARRLSEARPGQRPADVSRIQRDITATRLTLRDQAAALAALGADIDPAAISAFRALAAETGARLAALDEQRALATRSAPPLADLRALYTEVTRQDLTVGLARLDYAHDPEDRALVRRLLTRLVASAVVVERRPERHARWLRVEVTWTEGVRDLLDAGLLTLDPAPEPPVFATPTELRTAAQRRWRERKQQTAP